MRLVGRNIILTGASRGFGRYLACRLWEEGANLLLVASKHFNIDLPAERIDQHAETLAVDLSVAYAENPIVRRATLAWTKIDGLVNNAAIQGPIGPAWESDWSAWNKTLTVDLFAPINLCKAVVPKMLEHGSGKIVNLSGGGATNVRPNYSAYATAKTGLVRFSECLAAELAGTGIDVNCVSPGAMPTDMLPPGVTANPDAMQKAAELVIWLLSDESNGVTGKLLSAQWDDYKRIPGKFTPADKFTLRRVT
jgi:3-oxoacyl-[acyl-carrier protein] reductase